MGASSPDAAALPDVEDARRARAHRAPSTSWSARSTAARRTRSSWRCSRCCGASTAPTSTPRSCCARCRPRAAHVRHGPGRERRRGRRRRRAGVRVQGRVAQPPERGRAVPGRGHRRRRDPARHLRDRRAADRGARLAALRRARRPRERSRYLLDGAVAGIGHYGNSIGVPTIGGEVYFEAPYEQNCLVNAMALGLGRARAAHAQRGRRASATCSSCSAPRPAATASAARRCSPRAELGEADEDKRPTVQVGDPFEEKKLLECSLELLERGLLVSLQDLGAAGPDLVARRRWPPRARSGSTSTSRACRCARPAWSRSRSWSPSRRSGCSASSSPAQRRRGARGVREVGGPRRRRSARSPTRGAHARASTASELVGDMPVARARRRLPAVRPRARASPDAPLYPRAAARCSRPSVDRREALLALLRSPEHRLAPAAVRAVRLRSCSRARCAGPSRPTRPCSRCPTAARSACQHRRQRPPRRRRPLPRHDRGVLECAANLACVGRRAARHDQQPQLRQPREAAHRLAADRGGARPRRRAAARSRRRSSAATSRSTTRARPARSTRRR